MLRVYYVRSSYQTTITVLDAGKRGGSVSDVVGEGNTQVVPIVVRTRGDPGQSVSHGDRQSVGCRSNDPWKSAVMIWV